MLRGAAQAALATNVDLAPTFLELCGVALDPAFPPLDGKSLYPLLRSARPPPDWRTSVLIEYYFNDANLKCVEHCADTHNTYPAEDSWCTLPQRRRRRRVCVFCFFLFLSISFVRFQELRSRVFSSRVFSVFFLSFFFLLFFFSLPFSFARGRATALHSLFNTCAHTHTHARTRARHVCIS